MKRSLSYLCMISVIAFLPATSRAMEALLISIAVPIGVALIEDAFKYAVDHWPEEKQIIETIVAEDKEICVAIVKHCHTLLNEFKPRAEYAKQNVENAFNTMLTDLKNNVELSVNAANKKEQSIASISNKIKTELIDHVNKWAKASNITPDAPKIETLGQKYPDEHLKSSVKKYTDILRHATDHTPIIQHALFKHFAHKIENEKTAAHLNQQQHAITATADQYTQELLAKVNPELNKVLAPLLQADSLTPDAQKKLAEELRAAADSLHKDEVKPDEPPRSRELPPQPPTPPTPPSIYSLFSVHNPYVWLLGAGSCLVGSAATYVAYKQWHKYTDHPQESGSDALTT